MQLSQHQTAIIEKYIDTNIKYVDMKLEILDHMISEIEDTMFNKHVLFENAFKISVIKWYKLFKKDTKLLYFGQFYSAPKIVLNKAVKIYKPYLITYISLYILFFILFNNSKHLLINFASVSFNLVVKMLLVLALLIFNYIQLKTYFSKIKTTYSFIIKTHFISNIFLIIPLTIGDFINSQHLFSVNHAVFAFLGLYIVAINVNFYLKHLNATKQFLKLNLCN